MFLRPVLVFAAASFGVAALADTADAATFYFIRHAESTTNAGTATIPEEILDPPLTDLGRQQAQDLALALADTPLTHIYVSGYQRTALTIAPTAEGHGLTPVVRPEIGEWLFGSALTGDLYAQLADVMARWAAGDTAAKFEGAESLDELNARVLPGYREIVERHKDGDGVVAIVGHGGSIGWTMPFFAQNVPAGYGLANGLRNTAIVQVVLDSQGNPLVSNWDGTPFDAAGPQPAPVPLPASGVLLVAAISGLGAARRFRKAA